jgi:excisionase family DNA binding protein
MPLSVDVDRYMIDWKSGPIPMLEPFWTRSSTKEWSMKGKSAIKALRYEGPIKVMTVRDVSAYLHVSPSTIYRLLKRNQIPGFHVGSDWRFNVEAIDRWCSDKIEPSA